jgi:predicted chitinase
MDQVAAIERLLQFMVDDPTLTDIRCAAYMLATVKHETADTFEPVREAFHLSEDWRRKNLRYFPWYGRGFVQLTWEANYVKAGEKLGVDLTSDADAVMEPETSYKIMSAGMREGWFTGKRLDDYITPGFTDYKNARRIINGTDKASLIAGYAADFERCLGAACFADERGF